MLESLKNWWYGKPKPPTKLIQIENVTINKTYCCCCGGRSSLPDPPTVPLVLPPGDLLMFVRFKNVNIPPAPNNQQVQTGNIYIKLDGDIPEVKKPFDSYIPGVGGTVNIDVPEGSSGTIQFTYIDMRNNESLKGGLTIFANAADKTSPDAPTNMLQLGNGDLIDEPSPNPFAPVAPVEPTPADPTPAPEPTPAEPTPAPEPTPADPTPAPEEDPIPAEPTLPPEENPPPAEPTAE